MSDQSSSSGSVANRRFRSLFEQEWAGIAGLGLFFIVVVTTFSILSPYFLQGPNLMTIGSNMSVIGLMAVAGTPLIIAGGLDLSVAAIAGLCGVVVSMLFGAGMDIWLACLIAIAMAAMLGAINGILVTKLKLKQPPNVQLAGADLERFRAEIARIDHLRADPNPVTRLASRAP